MNQFTMEQKLEMVRAWRASGQTQEAFCAEHPGVAPRTLRTWARSYRRPEGSLERARAVLAGAVEELATILKTIEAAADDRVAGSGGAQAGTCASAEVPRPPPGSAAAAHRLPAEITACPTAGTDAPRLAKAETVGQPAPAAACPSVAASVEPALHTTATATRRPETFAERRARKLLANPAWKGFMEDL